MKRIENFNTKQLYQNWLNQKNILIFFPHPDDEIHLAGSFIRTVKDCTQAGSVHISCALFTNGDYYKMPTQRLVETKKSIKALGADDVIYMGYPETDFTDIQDKGELVSYNGLTHTYSIKSRPEYCFKKHGIHRKISFENIVTDIYEMISEIKPDVIICNLNDCHDAHIALSLAFNKAVKSIDFKEYEPLILRGYCYETAWTSPRDFFTKGNIRSSVRNVHTDISDDEWTKRLRLPNSNSCVHQYFSNNSIYKALKAHRSQLETGFAESIINGDSVFWIEKNNSIPVFGKIMVGDDFAYKLLVTSNTSMRNLSFYYFNGSESKIVNLSSEFLYVRVDSSEVSFANDVLYFKKAFKKCSIEVEHKESGAKDVITIKKSNRFSVACSTLIANFQRVFVRGKYVALKKLNNGCYNIYYRGSRWLKKTNINEKNCKEGK